MILGCVHVGCPIFSSGVFLARKSRRSGKPCLRWRRPSRRLLLLTLSTKVAFWANKCETWAEKRLQWRPWLLLVYRRLEFRAMLINKQIPVLVVYKERGRGARALQSFTRGVKITREYDSYCRPPRFPSCLTRLRSSTKSRMFCIGWSQDYEP